MAAFVSKQLGRPIKAGERLEVVDQHPILDAITQPAASLPGWNDWCLKYVTAASLELTGHAYWWFPVVKRAQRNLALADALGASQELADRVVPGLAAEGRRRQRRTRDRPRGNRAVLVSRSEEPVARARSARGGARSVMVDEYVVDAQKRAFQLGIHPGAVITVGSQAAKGGQPVRPRLRQWQRSQITEAINARYRGMTHFGEAMILDALIEDIRPYGNTPKQMDFGGNAEQRKPEWSRRSARIHMSPAPAD